MASPYKVVIIDFVNDDLEIEKRILGDLADVVALDAASERELRGHIDDADAIMLYHLVTLSRESIEQLRCCRLIVRCGVGYDNVDIGYASARGIFVANIPDYGTEEVADSAIGMLLALARGITFLNSRIREGAIPWSYTQVAPLRRLRGRVFAVVGLGRIGTTAALRAKALGMEVIFYDPYKPDGYEKVLGINRTKTFDELLRHSFVLSLHCPLTKETFHLVDRTAIAKMPAGSYLINTARGGVVDAAAIAPAIQSGQLAGAGIDVLEQEPPNPDDPLIAAWRNPGHPAYHRVLINPHSAFYCEEGFTEMRIKNRAQACRNALLGQTVPNVINHRPLIHSELEYQQI